MGFFYVEGKESESLDLTPWNVTSLQENSFLSMNAVMQSAHIEESFKEERMPWRILSLSDALVLTNESLVAKISRKGEEYRLFSGAHTSARLAAFKLPVLAPLNSEIFVSDFGAVSFWPFVKAKELSLSTLAKNPLSSSDAFLLGKSFGQLSLVKQQTCARYDFFEPFASRLKRNTWVDEKSRNILKKLVVSSQSSVDIISKKYGFTNTFCHGDASLTNVLLKENNELLLIDFDSSWIRPFGWDLACLFHSFCLENPSVDLFNEVEEGWNSVCRAVPKDLLFALANVKAVTATTFLLLFKNTPLVSEMFFKRLNILNAALYSSLPPYGLPPRV